MQGIRSASRSRRRNRIPARRNSRLRGSLNPIPEASVQPSFSLPNSTGSTPTTRSARPAAERLSPGSLGGSRTRGWIGDRRLLSFPYLVQQGSSHAPCRSVSSPYSPPDSDCRVSSPEVAMDFRQTARFGARDIGWAIPAKAQDSFAGRSVHEAISFDLRGRPRNPT